MEPYFCVGVKVDSEFFVHRVEKKNFQREQDRAEKRGDHDTGQLCKKVRETGNPEKTTVCRTMPGRGIRAPGITCRRWIPTPLCSARTMTARHEPESGQGIGMRIAGHEIESAGSKERRRCPRPVAEDDCRVKEKQQPPEADTARTSAESVQASLRKS